MTALAAVSIDLDAARHYHAIHGLPAPRQDHVVTRGLSRFLELCAARQLVGTIFVVSADLQGDARENSALRALLIDAAAAGHEIASHSHAHRYDLSRQAPAQIEADLTRSIDAITALVGKRPVGFRAPGYNQSEPLMAALDTLAFDYDSSFLAAPLYFAARAFVHGVMRVRGQHSASLVGDWRETLQRAPFRPRLGSHTQAARSRVEGRALIELPITGSLGAPLIGTTLSLSGAVGAALTRLALKNQTPLVLELHAIDLCDSTDVEPALLKVQPDARVALARKRAAIERALALVEQQRQWVTLATLARSS